jgi:hypothetical protein
MFERSGLRVSAIPPITAIATAVKKSLFSMAYEIDGHSQYFPIFSNTISTLMPYCPFSGILGQSLIYKSCCENGISMLFLSNV